MKQAQLHLASESSTGHLVRLCLVASVEIPVLHIADMLSKPRGILILMRALP